MCVCMRIMRVMRIMRLVTPNVWGVLSIRKKNTLEIALLKIGQVAI